MADRVKVYEERTRKGVPLLAWLLPLLLLLALLAYLLSRHYTAPSGGAAQTNSAQPALPSLGAVHFETDQAALTPDDQAMLDRAADAMKSNPNAHLRVEGFTDNAGSDTHNLTLSQRRANAVAEYLKSKGVDGSRLTGDGFGESNPVDTNATAAGKADNRRVELFTQQ